MTEITYCKERVYPSGLCFPRLRQCHKKAWKDGYCKIHHPNNVAARRQASEERHWKQLESSPSRRLCKAQKRIHDLETAIQQTLNGNKHLAEGENCTLILLKRVMNLCK